MKRGADETYHRLLGGLRFYAVLLSVSLVAFLAGCSSGGSGGTTQTQTPATYTIGGTVSGLSGSGLVLQDNGGNNLTITGNGSFAFTTAITSGGAYSVSVLTQPSSPTQTCSVTNGSGTATANVTNVQVACSAPTYMIGGTVSGLSGSGLVLQDNGGNNLAIAGNGSFTFTTAITSGGAYSVSVLTQPSSPTQTCSVTNGSGTASANVTNVQVACTTPVSGDTIGGTVSGLSGAGLVLQDNGGNNLPVTTDGNFTFSAAITSGDTYDVTVLTQPSTPAQTCTVTDGSGTAVANVSSVAVACADRVAPQWGWMDGADTNNAAGTYGTQGTGAAANSPGSRSYSVTWTDSSGNLWLFGGSGRDSAGNSGGLNDLWKYSGGDWTWVSGSNLNGQQGSYGTKGTASSGNFPGARANAVGWTDASGNFWLFGGETAVGSGDLLNDLWEYHNGEWTWVSGPDGFNNVGTYGTEGTAAAANVPGARNDAIAWIDTSGNLWLFGGSGYDSVGTDGGNASLNDLWKFTPSSGQWTWMGGSNLAGKSGTYGTLGTAASSNMPGARSASCTWTDKAGNLWLFGGDGLDSAGTSGPLNDLWKDNLSTGEWTWVGGSNLASQPTVYGTEGTPATTNVPGARFHAACWSDAAGNFWLFGGAGEVTPSSAFVNLFDDVWEYSSGEWAWVGGTDVAALPGTYGTLGTPAAGNLPGARYPAAWWVDASGNFWLFGGLGVYQVNAASNLNDLWEYEQ